jgi:WD40 repeat protein
LTSSFDGNLRLYEHFAGRLGLAATLRGHSGPVDCCSIGGMCRNMLAASGGRDGTVRIWDVSTNQTDRVTYRHSMQVLEGHTGRVTCVMLENGWVAHCNEWAQCIGQRENGDHCIGAAPASAASMPTGSSLLPSSIRAVSAESKRSGVTVWDVMAGQEVCRLSPVAPISRPLLRSQRLRGGTEAGRRAPQNARWTSSAVYCIDASWAENTIVTGCWGYVELFDLRTPQGTFHISNLML